MKMCIVQCNVLIVLVLFLPLLRLSGRHASELLEAGVIDVATQLMADQISVESVCSNCCGLMWNLSMMRHKTMDVRVEIGRKNGITLLLQSIQEHLNHTEILCRAFTALWNLLDCEDNMHIFMDQQGLELAVQVVRQRQHDCDLISLVSYHPVCLRHMPFSCHCPQCRMCHRQSMASVSQGHAGSAS